MSRDAIGKWQAIDHARASHAAALQGATIGLRARYSGIGAKAHRPTRSGLADPEYSPADRRSPVRHSRTQQFTVELSLARHRAAVYATIQQE